MKHPTSLLHAHIETNVSLLPRLQWTLYEHTHTSFLFFAGVCVFVCKDELCHPTNEPPLFFFEAELTIRWKEKGA